VGGLVVVVVWVCVGLCLLFGGVFVVLGFLVWGGLVVGGNTTEAVNAHFNCHVRGVSFWIVEGSSFIIASQYVQPVKCPNATNVLER
jgi:hypothetical protein